MPKSLVLLPSAKRRLLSSLTSGYSNDCSEEKGFALKSGTEFASRSDGIFGQLQDIEKCHQTWVSENKTEVVVDEPDVCNKDKEEDAVFKKPFEPITSRRRNFPRPLLRRNPKKWRKYSLADIPLSSDAANTSVALQFLDELRKRRENERDSVNSDCENFSKIAFSKPLNCSKNLKRKFAAASVSTELCAETVAHTSSKCLVEKDVGNKGTLSNFSVKLEHLQDECDEGSTE